MIRFVKRLPLIASMLGLTMLAEPALASAITTLKSPTCSCCQGWVDVMQASGFEVDVISSDWQDRAEHLHKAGIPSDLAACHTSIVNGYIVEGHVPPEVIKQLLEKQPNIAGVAVPGMPQGAVGMGALPPGAQYEILAIDKQGRVSTIATVQGN